MGAGFCAASSSCSHGIMRHVAIEQRRAERAIGLGAGQRGQGNFVGARTSG